MILTSPQPTPNLPKIHHLPFEFSTPSYGEVPYFVDHQDKWPPTLFKLIYFVAGSPRVVDYATLHGRTPYFEDTESLANDFNFSASWEATQVFLFLLIWLFIYFWLFFFLVFHSLVFYLFILGFNFCYFSFLFLFF